MKFLVTYPNGKKEVCSSEATTVEAYAMMHTGGTLEMYQGLNGNIEPADDAEVPLAEVPLAEVPLAEGISAVVHSTSF